METGKLNKDAYKDVDAAQRAFNQFCAKFDYCKDCPFSDWQKNCGVAFMYLEAPRRGRPRKNGELRMENGKCGGAK